MKKRNRELVCDNIYVIKKRKHSEYDVFKIKQTKIRDSEKI